MGISWLAILGIPPLSGYFSKEQVLLAAFEQAGIGVLAWVVGVVTAGLTAFYMSRLFFLTFHGERRWPEGRHPHESPPVMTIPLVILGALAAVGGLLNVGHDGALAHFLEPVFAGGAEETTAELAFSEIVLTAIVVGITLIGAAVAWYLYGSGRVQWLGLRERYAGSWRLVSNKLYVDEIYEAFTVTGGRALARLSWLFDQRILDGVVNGVAAGVLGLAERGRRVQSGLVRSYAVGVLAGAVVLVAMFVLSTTIR